MRVSAEYEAGHQHTTRVLAGLRFKKRPFPCIILCHQRLNMISVLISLIPNARDMNGLRCFRSALVLFWELQKKQGHGNRRAAHERFWRWWRSPCCRIRRASMRRRQGCRAMCTSLTLSRITRRQMLCYWKTFFLSHISFRLINFFRKWGTLPRCASTSALSGCPRCRGPASPRGPRSCFPSGPR